MMMIVSSSRHARRVLYFVAGPCFTAAPARRRTALSMASSDSLQDFQRVELEAVNKERRRQHDVSVGSARIGNGTDEGFLAGFEQELELCKEALDAWAEEYTNSTSTRPPQRNAILTSPSTQCGQFCVHLVVAGADAVVGRRITASSRPLRRFLYYNTQNLDSETHLNCAQS